MQVRPTDILDHGHRVGFSIASVLAEATMNRIAHDREVASAHREIASVQQLAAALRDERARANRLAAELATMRTRALKAEATCARYVRS